MKENLGLVPSCTKAWKAVTADIFNFQGNSYLIVACCFSGYIEKWKIILHEKPLLLLFPYLQSMMLLELFIVTVEQTI